MKCPDKTCECEVIVVICRDGHARVIDGTWTTIGVPTISKDKPPAIVIPPIKSGARLKTEGFVMPFGKYKGTPIADLPVHYLQWALENMEHLDTRLRNEMENELALREIGE